MEWFWFFFFSLFSRFTPLTNIRSSLVSSLTNPPQIDARSRQERRSVCFIYFLFQHEEQHDPRSAWPFSSIRLGVLGDSLPSVGPIMGTQKKTYQDFPPPPQVCDELSRRVSWVVRVLGKTDKASPFAQSRPSKFQHPCPGSVIRSLWLVFPQTGGDVVMLGDHTGEIDPNASHPWKCSHPVYYLPKLRTHST